MLELLTKIFRKNIKIKTNNCYPQEDKLGHQDIKEENGRHRIVRRNAEKFDGKIKGVKVEDMQEDFYQIDNI